jgi:RNA polymerase sigma factor (sigma-70 family)
MSGSPINPLLLLIRRIRVAGDGARLTDGALLERYAAQRDDAAFEILVHRHGPMVWRVCRQLLWDVHAAEDAFQATFLVLVSKAGTLSRPELLANWLYGVAHRVARRARKTEAVRQEKEAHCEAALATAESTPDAGSAGLHEELQYLPAKYRAPMVLCYLEGHTQEEAAQKLCWPVGTVKVRLMRGRDRLRQRMERRGLAPTVGAISAILAESRGQGVSAAVVSAACRAALTPAAAAVGSASPNALRLSAAVIASMRRARRAMVAASLLALGFVTLALGTLAAHSFNSDQTPSLTPESTARRPAQSPQQELKMTDVQRLQGTWRITALENNGMTIPEVAASGSKITINGNLFTTSSMGAVYEGTFKVDESKKPKTLDLTFNAGPEKGNTALAIYELDGDTWKLCLSVTSKLRPTEFAAKAGSGHAFEILKRETAAFLKEEASKKKEQPAKQETAAKPTPDESKEIARLEGEWVMVSGESSGQALPASFVKTGKRVAKSNEITVSFGGQVMLKATYRLDLAKKPRTIDYSITDGPFKGMNQQGIYEWDGENFKVCFGTPGKERPTEFTTRAGDGNTFTVWKKAK